MKTENFEEMFGAPNACELCGSLGHKKEECPYEYGYKEEKEKKENIKSVSIENWWDDLQKRSEEYLEYLKIINENESEENQEKSDSK